MTKELERIEEERARNNAFMHHTGIEMVDVDIDLAKYKLTIRPETKNPYGLLHGGAIYTLADNATGAAACSDGRYYVTQTSSLHFLRNVAEGTVYATATVRHRARYLPDGGGHHFGNRKAFGHGRVYLLLRG